MITIYVNVQPKANILDPQGKTIHHALQNLGFQSIQEIRIGKRIKIIMEAASVKEATTKAQEMCEKLLINPLIEEYTLEVAS
ncbi:MAG: phosphoribosylformylglycinamidine synthase subunit PurS [Caldisericia bacterium]|nr:phosphoribosylformylglycinamidine synthase subunit PurS [Caldisericia bacterium]